MNANRSQSHSKENAGLTSLNKAPAPSTRVFGKEILNKKPPPPGSTASIDSAPSISSAPPIPPCLSNSLGFLMETCGRVRASRDYLSRQPHINEKMRAILVDWMVDVSQKFKLQPQSLFIAVNLVDRYLDRRPIERSRLQLAGVAALMIVGKYEEIYPPLLKDYVGVCDCTYTPEEIVAMEGEMLIALEFDLCFPVSLVILQFIRAFVELDERVYSFCHYLLESAMLDVSHLDFSAAELACGALFLAGKLFKKKAWTSVEEGVTRVSHSRAKAVGKQLFLIMQRNDASDLGAIKCKFASPKYFEVSRFKIEKVSADHAH